MRMCPISFDPPASIPFPNFSMQKRSFYLCIFRPVFFTVPRIRRHFNIVSVSTSSNCPNLTVWCACIEAMQGGNDVSHCYQLCMRDTLAQGRIHECQRHSFEYTHSCGSSTRLVGTFHKQLALAIHFSAQSDGNVPYFRPPRRSCALRRSPSRTLWIRIRFEVGPPDRPRMASISRSGTHGKIIITCGQKMPKHHSTLLHWQICWRTWTTCHWIFIDSRSSWSW